MWEPRGLKPYGPPRLVTGVDLAFIKSRKYKIPSTCWFVVDLTNCQRLDQFPSNSSAITGAELGEMWMGVVVTK
jgi:hypothetical protein